MELKVGAIINTSSGGCDADSEAEMLDLLKGANVGQFKTWCGESDQIERAFAEAATHKPNMLVVLGGDGPSAQLQKRALEPTLIFSRFQAGR